MQVATELRGMFSYSIFPIIITTIILIGVLVCLKYKKKNISKHNIIIPSKKDINEIKMRYLNTINILLNDFNGKKITNRQAYQNLSSIIRNFIFETTHIKVQNYILSDIKNVNIPILYELVSEYYDPEFSKISKGNILLSIEKTRKVIEKWN